ncbi:prepilin-type N-terminal cleavage/methylation domain-containing protein [Caloramator sp. mosi_1]|uniref:type II secretion system protein n=1 Tax=Caloramator sp. mosi_1 TaxID=3023090 RepID=UPI00235E9D01|nr:prepilin-type N-terminal cleavage/methylation domain-containing protein [Caloramator sp. mosi_1]WDC83230.1 prepilin-type N-terminal cleavage/methylation domain-containing protein [Caloramator sp. mosi_1]
MIRGKDKGYTLVELLVAFAIFAILIVPISSIINMNIKNNSKSKDNIEIANIINYAYESYINGEEINNYMGYDIEYVKEERVEDYKLKGIRYDDYDLIIEVTANKIKFKYSYRHNGITELKDYIVNDFNEINNYRIEIISDEENLIYKINDIEITTTDSTAGILLILNNSAEKELNMVIDGVKETNNIKSKIINFAYIKYQEDKTTLNLASVYPNVNFEEKNENKFTEEQKSIN